MGRGGVGLYFIHLVVWFYFLMVCDVILSFLSTRGIVEEAPSTAEHGRPSVMLEKYASATKMQPQSSGSLRSNAGIEKGKEIAARLNVHRIHSQLRGLDSTGRLFLQPLCCPGAEWGHTFLYVQK